MRTLHGHTTPETAYLVRDYPHGFQRRCMIRYWIETRAKFGSRFMSQTTRPIDGQVKGEECQADPASMRWNKPKASTYVALAVMYLDDAGHVQWDALHMYASAENFERFDAQGFELDEDQTKARKLLEAISRKASPNHWAEWDAKHTQPCNDDPDCTTKGPHIHPAEVPL